jgi:hypothetical protein
VGKQQHRLGASMAVGSNANIVLTLDSSCVVDWSVCVFARATAGVRAGPRSIFKSEKEGSKEWIDRRSRQPREIDTSKQHVTPFGWC